MEPHPFHTQPQAHVESLDVRWPPPPWRVVIPTLHNGSPVLTKAQAAQGSTRGLRPPVGGSSLPVTAASQLFDCTWEPRARLFTHVTRPFSSHSLRPTCEHVMNNPFHLGSANCPATKKRHLLPLHSQRDPGTTGLRATGFHCSPF